MWSSENCQCARYVHFFPSTCKGERRQVGPQTRLVREEVNHVAGRMVHETKDNKKSSKPQPNHTDADEDLALLTDRPEDLVRLDRLDGGIIGKSDESLDCRKRDQYD